MDEHGDADDVDEAEDTPGPTVDPAEPEPRVDATADPAVDPAATGLADPTADPAEPAPTVEDQRTETLRGVPSPAIPVAAPIAEPEPARPDHTVPMAIPPPVPAPRREPEAEVESPQPRSARGPEPEPSVELEIDVDEVHMDAAVPSPLSDSSSSRRRVRHAAGPHQSLAGVPLRQDTGAFASIEPGDEGDEDDEGGPSDQPSAPRRTTGRRRGPPRRRGRRPTGTFASVGPRSRRQTLTSLAAVGLRTEAQSTLARDPDRDPEGDRDPESDPAAAPTDETPPRARPRTIAPGAAQTGFHKPLSAREKLGRLWEELGLRVGQRIAEAVGDDHLYLLLMAVVVGVASGAAAGLLLLWIARAIEVFPAVGQTFPSFGWIYAIGAPAIGGLMVGGLRLFARRYIGEIPEGIPAVVEAVSQQGKLEGPAGGVLAIGTGLTIASGGSVGHEGPTVALGATVGSVLGRFFGLRMRRQTTMLGAGCAAGLAAAFNAPLAGVIFTVEVVFKRSVGTNVGTMSVFTPLIVAAVAGTFTSHAIFGERTEFIAAADIAGNELLLEMFFFLIVAVVAGLLSPLMSRVVLFVNDRFAALERLPEWIKPAIGGLAVGLLATLLFTDLLGPGRGIVYDALHSRLAWQIAIALALLKIVTTALTIGSGGMGGVFMPSLVIGACVGTAVHALAELALGPGVSQPAAYALVGMGAYLGATLRAPLTPIVMIFELTGDYHLILPLMFACILSAFVAGRLEEDTLFDLTLRRRGSTRALDNDEGAVMQRGRVGDLMVRPDHMLRLDSSFEELQRAALVEDTPTLYLLDDDERVAGMIDTRHLAARALRGEIEPHATAGELNEDDRPTVLVPDDTLAGAMMAFARSGRDVLPVVDPDRRVLGLIERTDLMAHYSEHVLEQQHAEVQLRGSGLGHEVDLGLGVTLERIVVRRSWAGHSLAQLDLRRRVNVQVLEWRRKDELRPLDPHARLREGDILAVAGTRENLLATRWVDPA